jgi:hypothetical protein
MLAPPTSVFLFLLRITVTLSPCAPSRRKQRRRARSTQNKSAVMMLPAFRARGLQLIPHMPPLLLALLPIIFHVGLAASPCNPSHRFHASFARALMISFPTRRLDVRRWSHF